MIPPTTGIVGLALVSVALAMIAYAINVEALGTTAALGAFMAPVLLGRDDANANLLLLYLASMAAGLGLVAARRRWRSPCSWWRRAISAWASGAPATARGRWALLLYGVIGGTAGLYVGLQRAVVGDTAAHLLRRLGLLGAAASDRWRRTGRCSSRG